MFYVGDSPSPMVDNFDGNTTIRGGGADTILVQRARDIQLIEGTVAQWSDHRICHSLEPQ